MLVVWCVSCCYAAIALMQYSGAIWYRVVVLCGMNGECQQVLNILNHSVPWHHIPLLVLAMCKCIAIHYDYSMHDVVEVHCYVVNIGRTDCEQIRSRIDNNWFWHFGRVGLCQLRTELLLHNQFTRYSLHGCMCQSLHFFMLKGTGASVQSTVKPYTLSVSADALRTFGGFL